jgi:hypothetical protein
MGAVNSLHNQADRSDGEQGVWYSGELQRLAHTICQDPLYKLDFSMTIADPTLEDCPLVACSIGFSALTGYAIQEIVGKSCRFLLNGVPQDLIDQKARSRARSYCNDVRQNVTPNGPREQLPDGLKKTWGSLSSGELICVQTNARKSGELFKNMFYLRQVSLDDNLLIVGLQARLSENMEVNMSELQKVCKKAFGSLDSNMSSIERVFAARFWYEAPMRRQFNEAPSSKQALYQEGVDCF